MMPNKTVLDDFFSTIFGSPEDRIKVYLIVSKFCPMTVDHPETGEPEPAIFSLSDTVIGMEYSAILIHPMNQLHLRLQYDRRIEFLTPSEQNWKVARKNLLIFTAGLYGATYSDLPFIKPKRHKGSNHAR